jgi:hypothetical protein
MPDIFFDHFCGQVVSHARSAVSGAQKITVQESLLDLWKLLKNDLSRHVLENTHNLYGRPLWGHRGKTYAHN